MALNIMQKIKPVGTFPAVDAEDVLMPDGTRLSEKTFTPGESTSQDAVLYTSQTLTEAQKLQARQNIDAASATDMENEIDRLDEAIAGIGTGGSITVDSELSATSTNPVQNKVITAQMNQAMTTLQNVVLPRLTPTVSSADNGKVLTVDGGVWVAKESAGGSGGSITVDSALNPNSTNPVQNKVICEQLAQANTVLGQLQASIPTESAINALIDAKLGVIENAAY